METYIDAVEAGAQQEGGEAALRRPARFKKFALDLDFPPNGWVPASDPAQK
jgi:hypothetical protein